MPYEGRGRQWYRERPEPLPLEPDGCRPGAPRVGRRDRSGRRLRLRSVLGAAVASSPVGAAPRRAWTRCSRRRASSRSVRALLGNATGAPLPTGRVRPARSRADRGAWGLPSAATVFVVSFDVGSDVDRKNPMAAIDAFQLAFPSEQDVVLAIKTKPYPDDPGVPGPRRGSARAHLWRSAHPARRARADLRGGARAVRELRRHGLDAPLGGARAPPDGGDEPREAGRRHRVVGEHGLHDARELGRHALPARAGPGAAPEVPGGDREGAARCGRSPSSRTSRRRSRALHREPGRRLELGRNAARDMERRREELRAGGTFDALERQLAKPAGPRRLWPGVRKTARMLRAEKLRRRRAGSLAS